MRLQILVRAISQQCGFVDASGQGASDEALAMSHKYSSVKSLINYPFPIPKIVMPFGFRSHLCRFFNSFFFLFLGIVCCLEYGCFAQKVLWFD